LPTISNALTEASHVLREAGVDEPRRTAGSLLQHALGVDRAHLLARDDQVLSENDFQNFIRLVNRRAGREPLQYVAGHQEFFGLDFKVTPDVLIPRPETEHLVERVLSLSRKDAALQSRGPLIADVGTGSGCIAVALAVSIPESRVLAIDISPGAIQVARYNAEAHSVGDRIEFLEGDLLAPLEGRELEGKLDFIVSNPPYVPDADIDHLQREVRCHEPRVALSGGRQGLDFYRRLLDESPAYVKQRGYLVCEIGFSQLDCIRDLIASPPWELIEVTADLQGIPRTLTIQRT